jgi:hypothetical protein
MRNGQVVPQYYNGCEIENPGEWPPREIPPWGAVPREAKRKVSGIRNAIARLLRP